MDIIDRLFPSNLIWVFLGSLQCCKLAIALTGEPGAGKSYLSFEIAKAFAEGGFRVKYYSLEEGICKLTQDKLVKYGLETTSVQ